MSAVRPSGLLPRRKRHVQISKDHFQYRNQSGSHGNPSLRHVTTIRQTNIRPYHGKGDQPPWARDDEGVSGVIEMKISEDWMQLKKEVDRVWRDYSCHWKDQPNAQMCRLLVLGEDHRFRYHPGFDPIALCRAAWRTCVCGRREGGSTIAMQLTRVLTRRYDATILRKAREIALAVQLTQYVPREDLPGLYLWVAYCGLLWMANEQLSPSVQPVGNQPQIARFVQCRTIGSASEISGASASLCQTAKHNRTKMYLPVGAILSI